MKKFITALLLVSLFAGISSAEVTGTLAKSNTSEEKFVEEIGIKNNRPLKDSPMLAVLLAEGVKDPSRRFYDSLSMMLLALGKGEIDSIGCPELIGEYILRHSQEHNLHGYMITRYPVNLAFGFLEENKELCAKFSKVVEDMGSEGKIGMLARDFITGPAAMSGNLPTVSFEEFDDAETLTAAITGDMPPIDYVGADGEPAGFNVAILAEIGRRLHVNIKPVVVDTASRAAALKSGRADVVFWFQVFAGYDVQPDVPEGVITSRPYYGWNKSVLIGKK